MGTYTTNYNLFMPSIGEQGWGTLVNGNFTTIDTAMKGLDTRVGTLENETDVVTAKIDALEGVSNDGDIKSKSVTNSGTITSTGLIIGNGGFKGNITGNVTGNLNGGVYVNVTTTSDSSIGSYNVVPSATTIKAESSTNFSQVSVQTETITINSVAKTKKKGFEFDDTVKIKVTLSATCADVGVQSCALYKNGTLLTSTNNTTLDIEPMEGDTFYATAKSNYSSRYNSWLRVNITLSGLTAKWYIA